MACAYWRAGLAEREAVFHLFFRRQPFGGGFAIACGVGPFVELLERFRFDADDLAYLATIEGRRGPLFPPEFLAFLGDLRLECEVAAIPEGTAVFPQEPMVRVRGPLLHCQLLETPLLNLVNFQTLVATKAARVWLAAGGQEGEAGAGSILEFGLRRAHGIDGGLSAARAAFVGGCAATSNVLAGQVLGIPVKGTHAHSWVMAFEEEIEAFRAFAEVFPDDTVLLVDTYDSEEGIARAVEVGRELAARGHELVGLRLDSGDLAALSQIARRALDIAGLATAVVVASGDLDESRIADLRRRGARIDVWGVGTRLVTGRPDASLGGVYKLAAVRRESGWMYTMKISEELSKATNPGILQVRRLARGERFLADVLYNEQDGPPTPGAAVEDPAGLRSHAPEGEGSDLLIPLWRGGRVAPPEPLDALRSRTLDQLGRLPPDVVELEAPARYPVLQDCRLADLRRDVLERIEEREGVG